VREFETSNQSKLLSVKTVKMEELENPVTLERLKLPTNSLVNVKLKVTHPTKEGKLSYVYHLIHTKIIKYCSFLYEHRQTLFLNR
jgi:hypothetical protein